MDAVFLNNQANADLVSIDVPERKVYKAAGLAMFVMAMGHLLSRVLLFFIAQALASSSISAVAYDITIDIIFSVLAQIVFCVVAPFLVYKFYLGRSTRQIISDSHFNNKASVPTLLISVLIGIAGIFLSIVISLFVTMILMLFGFNFGSGATAMPEQFNIGLFFVSLFLIMVLPSICEEFAMRGLFLTAMKSMYVNVVFLIIMGLSFGLFHQNVRQFVQTAVAGGIMAFVVVKSGSIWPAVIIHAVNNGLAVVMDYAQTYGWGGGFMDRMFALIASGGFFSMLFVGALAVGVIVPSCFLIAKEGKKRGGAMVTKRLYKPSLKESSFLIGALVLTVLSTIMTIAFGM